jgi:hypothetical protein
MQGIDKPVISLSQTTARAPRAVASVMKVCPSAELPFMATKRFPGSTLRLSIAMPVIETSGICAGEKANGNSVNKVLRVTGARITFFSSEFVLFIWGSFTINKKDLTG